MILFFLSPIFVLIYYYCYYYCYYIALILSCLNCFLPSLKKIIIIFTFILYNFLCLINCNWYVKHIIYFNVDFEHMMDSFRRVTQPCVNFFFFILIRIFPVFHVNFIFLFVLKRGRTVGIKIFLAYIIWFLRNLFISWNLITFTPDEKDKISSSFLFPFFSN